jgi:hypothetical protein
MSTVFLVLIGLALTGLAFITYQYFHTKKIEQETAAREKMKALMEAYRQRRQEKKDSSEEKPDINELTAEIESLPIVPDASLYWRKIWYIGLAVVAVFGLLWIAVEMPSGGREQKLTQGSSHPKTEESREVNHLDETGITDTHGKKPKLELMKMSHSHYGKQVIINGLVRNVSKDTLKNSTVVLIFADAEENFLTSAQSRMVFSMLLPGEESPFKVETIHDDRMVGYRVNFRTQAGAPIPYVDIRETSQDYINPPSKEKTHEDDEEEDHHEGTW